MEKLERMVQEVESQVRQIGATLGKVALDARVINALREVPRHEFVPASQLPLVYENEALPVGHGQIIPQPGMVAVMTDLLRLDGNDVVLEVGTGTGYHTAVLSQLVRKVYSVEANRDMAAAAGPRLQRLGYGNIEVHAGNGYFGWREHAPYDAILVTAAVDEIPRPLIDQLKRGGRMVVPVNHSNFGQDLLLIERNSAGTIATTEIMAVSFPPLACESGGYVERHA